MCSRSHVPLASSWGPPLVRPARFADETVCIRLYSTRIVLVHPVPSPFRFSSSFKCQSGAAGRPPVSPGLCPPGQSWQEVLLRRDFSYGSSSKKVKNPFDPNREVNASPCRMFVYFL